MSEEKVRQLVSQLKKEVNDSNLKDDELLDIIDQLEADIEKKTFFAGDDSANINDTVLALEARLNTNHPIATRVIEELIDILGNIGI